jgi:hypothetical protein
MTHRLDFQKRDGATVIEFQGLLDPAALDVLRAAVARVPEGLARIVLRAGSEVERACLPGLRALDAEVVAESPYLARWIGKGMPR